MRGAEAIFTAVYHANAWSDGESRSGPGSTLEITGALRAALPALLRRLGVRRLLDVPCGDLNWMCRVDLPVDSYIGADIVGTLIDDLNRRYANDQRRFVQLDLVRDELPESDLVLCRDGLVHLPHSQVLEAVTNIKRSGAEYLLATTFPNRRHNANILVPGLWRPLNLEKSPYSFPPALELIDEGNTYNVARYPAKSMGLWRVSDLPSLEAHRAVEPHRFRRAASNSS